LTIFGKLNKKFGRKNHPFGKSNKILEALNLSRQIFSAKKNRWAKRNVEYKNGDG
jgi:hypothetical protein